MMTRLRPVSVLLLGLWLGIAASVLPVTSALAQSDAPPAAAQTGPDYQAWSTLAQIAESLIEDSDTPSETLQSLRAQLVTARTQFLTAQDTNRSRIDTVRNQIDALGPAPEEGATESPEIADRRAELQEQLLRLQAPGLAADEAFRRADGLIRQIDQILRERDADALLTLWPSPVNPANWLAGLDALVTSAHDGIDEVLENLENPARQTELRSNLVVVIGALLLAALLVLRGYRWTEDLTIRLQDGARSQRGRQAMTLLTSLSQIAVPLAGVFLFTFAIEASSLPGETGSDALSGLFLAGLSYLVARWLGNQIFTHSENAYTPLRLPSVRRREGRFMAALTGVLLGLQAFFETLVQPRLTSDAAHAVLAFPVLVMAGIVLFRIGQLLVMHTRLHHEAAATDPEGEVEDETAFFDRLVGIVGRVSMLLGLAAPLLAAIGYVQAAQALLFPAIGSLGLMGLLVLLQGLVKDLYAVVVRSGNAETEALVPALIGFGLAVLSVPLFALIWGVRPAELLEIWQLVREGFRIGDTRISPMNLLTFVLVFAVGYTVTRVLQGALGSSVLPKTTLDKGGQKAVVAGTGYVGIFIAALLAFSTAGIDLSALALVAGALSVGIGFGLQNIVSNFISGIILLVERPIAEGDWIEVGENMGVVRSISVRSTVIETFDKTDVIVPNADLIQGTVTNWTHYNNTGRLIVKVGVAYGSDTRLVARVLQEVAEAEPLAVLNPPPSVLFMGFGADSLDFEIRMILRDVAFKLAVASEMHHEIARRFKESGIEIPFAQRDIWLRNPEALRGDPAPPAAPLQPAALQPDPPGHERRRRLQRDEPDVPELDGDATDAGDGPVGTS